MIAVLLVVHIMVAVSLIGVVLLQRSEGGALGIGGGGGGGFMTGRGAGNALTKTTAVLAAMFFATSMGLTMMAGRQTTPTSIFGEGAEPQRAAAPCRGSCFQARRRHRRRQNPQRRKARKSRSPISRQSRENCRIIAR